MLRNNSASGHTYGEGRNLDKKVLRYSRVEMLNLRNASSSLTRPQYLSTEFDNDEGKFSPEKWLEFRWVYEGVENRPNSNAKRKEKLKIEVLEGDTTVLSPQRRGFSSGCRATSPTKNETEIERLGANKTSWRSGAGFQLKSSGTEFKTPFQKSSGGNCESSFIRMRVQNGSLPGSVSNWRSSDASFKPNYQKECGQSQRGKSVGAGAEEKIPEWLEGGPTSMHDMIELRGFDDENKIRRDISQRSKEDLPEITQQSEFLKKSDSKEILSDQKKPHTDGGKLGISTAVNFGPPHTKSTDNSVTASFCQSFTLADNGNSLSAPLLNGKLPNSDAEFAAIMGILGDADLDSLKKNELKSPVTKEPTGSRLSRFFATKVKPESIETSSLGSSKNEYPQQKLDAPSSSSVFDSSPNEAPISVLNKIFPNACQRSSHSPFLPELHVTQSIQGVQSVQGVLRVEDLERNIQKDSVQRNSSVLPATVDGIRDLMINEQLPPNSRQPNIPLQVSKGNPLGDPHQQAHLMRKLNRFARLQDGMTDDVFRVTEDSYVLSSKASPAPSYQLPGVSLNSQATSFTVPPAVSDMTLQAAFLHSQYEKAAALQAFVANQQRPTLSQGMQSVDNNVLKQVLASMMTNGAVQQAPPRPVGSSVTSAQTRTSVTTSLPNAFMPTSVMRQLTKNNSGSISVEEKLRHPTVPTCSMHYNVPKANVIPEHLSAPHKPPPAETVIGGNISPKNASDWMARLALQHQQQHQYAQMLAAMQNGLSFNNWQQNAQFAAVTAAARAQTLAAQAEQQRQFTLAVMRGDVGQAQAIRARFLSQQAAAFAALPNVPLAPHPHQVAAPLVPVQPAVSAAASVPQNTQPPPTSTTYKYQNPLEKLLQSAGVQASKGVQPSKKTSSQGSASRMAASDLPAIVSRLPPTANCISVEELEKQFAAE